MILLIQGCSIMDRSTILCTCKHAVNVHDPVIFDEVSCMCITFKHL